MNRPVSLSFILILALGAGTAFAQDTNPTQQPGVGSGQGMGRGQRGGRGGYLLGSGVTGTVTEVAPDHYTIKTDSGDLYTVHYSVNTRIMKGGGGPRRAQGDQGMGSGPANPPQQIKPTDIRVGDAIAANGEVDAAAKSVGAVFVLQIDPERAKQMREMQANYGKTWLMGKVTAVNELKVTLQGGPGNQTSTFVADENTTFRKRRDPVTLADVQVGDMVRVEGALKNGEFVAKSVAVMGPPQERGMGMQQGGSPAPAPPQ
jgi:hypothetical protein